MSTIEDKENEPKQNRENNFETNDLKTNISHILFTDNILQNDQSSVNKLTKESKNVITINTISNCQNCQNTFNLTDKMPYLFKCGHFYCKNCIMNKFSDNNIIKCPEDDTKVTSL